MPLETVETYPPFFLGHFLSGTDNGRVQLVKVQTVLG